MVDVELSEDLTGVVDDYFGISEESRYKKNFYVNKRVIPLGTYNKLMNYRYGDVPDGDVVQYPVRGESINILICAWSGMQKTQLLKRIVYYLYRMGYDVLIFDPKHTDWLDARKAGVKNRLLPLEQPDNLPIYPVIPSYVEVELLKHQKKYYKKPGGGVFSFNMQDMNKMLEWQTMGITELGTDMVIQTVKKQQGKNIDKIIAYLNRTKAIPSSTKKSMIPRLQMLRESNFFDPSREDLDLKSLWMERKIPAISFFSNEPKYIEFVVGKLLARAKQISESEIRHRKKVFVFDDSKFYAENKDKTVLSTLNIVNSQVNWRSLGFNNIVVIQDPQFLHPNILDNCKDKIIGRLGNPENFLGSIGRGGVEALKNLRLDSHNHYSEYLWMRPDGSYRTFFTLDPIVGHSFN